MTHVTWFEIPATNFKRAKDFYEASFNTKLDEQVWGNVKMAWFPMRENMEGSAGTVIEAEGYTPSKEGTLVYLEVDDIDETLKNIEANGGKTVQPKATIGDGEYGSIAKFEDSEGNNVALHMK